MDFGQSEGALFARAVDPDEDAAWRRNLRRQGRQTLIFRHFLAGHGSCIGNCGKHRSLPAKQPGIGGSADLGPLAHPRRSGRDLCGKAREQGHKSKDKPVHCAGI